MSLRIFLPFTFFVLFSIISDDWYYTLRVLAEVCKVHEDLHKIQLEPDTAVYYRNRGVAHNKLGQYETAIADYTKAIQLDPEYALAFYNRGVVLGILGKDALAKENFDKACELDKSHC